MCHPNTATELRMQQNDHDRQNMTLIFNYILIDLFELLWLLVYDTDLEFINSVTQYFFFKFSLSLWICCGNPHLLTQSSLATV